MGFRQGNKTKRQQQTAYEAWLAANRDLLSRSGLPASVLQSRDDWAYFLFFRYHDHGNWNTPPLSWIDFTWDDLSPAQRETVQLLEVTWNEHVGSHPILAKRIPAQKTV